MGCRANFYFEKKTAYKIGVRLVGSEMCIKESSSKMSDEIYLTITGEQQGCISSRCGTSASIGNRWQIGHEDEIFAFSLSNSITNTGKGSQLHGLSFCKLIDKSSPLLINAINNNEQLFMEFDFYRINRFGR